MGKKRDDHLRQWPLSPTTAADADVVDGNTPERTAGYEVLDRVQGRRQTKVHYDRG
jgi:hypothetical protein